MGIADEKHIVTQTELGKMGKISNSNFQVLRINCDPTYTTGNVYVSYTKKFAQIPLAIQIGTHAHIQCTHSLQSPDNKNGQKHMKKPLTNWTPIRW